MSNDFSKWSRPALESFARAMAVQRDEAVKAADEARREAELRIRYWDADFNEITRDEAIQRARDAA